MINPESLIRDTEESHQIAIFAWRATMVEKYPELAAMYAIPNGGYRNKREAARFKAAGVLAGVPDICLPVPASLNIKGENYLSAALYIELKLPKYKKKALKGLNSNQKKVIHLLNDCGNLVLVCFGYHQAISRIEDYVKHTIVRK